MDNKKEVKGILLDVYNGTYCEKTVTDELESYYEILGCRVIDIVDRSIDGRVFEIVCDEEGLLVENPKVSALDEKMKPMLVGNLFICQCGNDDNLKSLEDNELKFIKKKIASVSTAHYPDPYPVLTKVGYV